MIDWLGLNSGFAIMPCDFGQSLLLCLGFFYLLNGCSDNNLVHTVAVRTK